MDMRVVEKMVSIMALEPSDTRMEDCMKGSGEWTRDMVGVSCDFRVVIFTKGIIMKGRDTAKVQ